VDLRVGFLILEDFEVVFLNASGRVL